MTRASPGTIVAAVLLPPLGVYWRRGAGRDFAIDCALTLAGWLPGVAFALWTVLAREPDPAFART